MNSGWKTAALGDVCHLYQPKTLSAKAMVASGPYPVFGANGPIGRHDAFNHEHPELVVGCRGSCGTVHVTAEKSWITGNAMVVRPKKESLSVKYVEYFLRGICNFSKVITGAAQPQITRQSLAPVPIAYPAKAEQLQIVAALDQAFQKISTAVAAVQSNLKNTKDLFENAVTHAVFLESDDPNTHNLGDLCDILDSRRRPITKRDRVAGDYPYYGATGILDHVANYLFDEPLVLLGEDGAKWGSGDRSAFRAAGKYWVNNHAHVLRPHRDRILDPWLVYCLNAADLSPHITGMTVPKLNQEKMRQIAVPVPPLPEQQRIVAQLDALAAQTQRLAAIYRDKLARLAALQHAILQKAFAGDLQPDSLAA